MVADALSRAPMKNDNTRQKKICNRNVFEIGKDVKICQMIEGVNTHINLRITSERIEQIKEETSRDSTMQRLVLYITTGWPRYVQEVYEDCKIYFKYKNELSAQAGYSLLVIFRNDQIVIPFELRKNIIDKIHVAHRGVEATLSLARQTIF